MWNGKFSKFFKSMILICVLSDKINVRGSVSELVRF